MSARDQGPELKDLLAQAIAEADADAADETREYRPLSVALAAQRLATSQQLKELAKLAELVPPRPPDEARALLTPPPAVASAPVPAAPVLPIPPASSRPPDQTLQLAPIGPAFAEATAALAEEPVARVRWPLVLSMLAVALPASLLLWPAPAARPAAVRAAEPATPTPIAPIQAAESSTRVVTESVVPQVSVTAPVPARRPRGASTPKPASSYREGNPSPPHPTQTIER
jgi:hypothetical protein